METTSNKNKRKQRKTRKNLNEIRKRLNKARSLLDPSCKVNQIQNNRGGFNNCITTSRLTLGLFHKAVRSETITRSVLHEIKKCNIIKVSNDKNYTNKSKDTFLQNISESNHALNCSYDKISIEKSNPNKIVNGSFNSREDRVNYSFNIATSPILFSPSQKYMQKTDIDEQNSTTEIKSMPTHSTNSYNTQEDNNYKRYEEFINDLPKYLMENAPALVNKDVMKKTKSLLYNIYLEGCRHETEDNILNCINSNLTSEKKYLYEEALEQNPMDYIRIGYVWQNRRQHKTRSPTGSSISSQTNLDTPDTINHSFIHDTPEYIYFPHKLIQ